MGERKILLKKTDWKLAFELFLYFFRISWYTFGGGFSIIAQMQREYVEKKHYITSEELLDLTSVGKSLPGVMIGNISFMFGYHVAGVGGAFLSVIGMSIPCIIILSVVTVFYTFFRDDPYVARALRGVRASVVPIILASTLKLYPAALTDWFTWIIMTAAVVMLLFTKVSAILIVIGAAVIGLLAAAVKTHFGKGEEDA